MGVKVEGFDAIARSFDAALESLNDERAVTEMALEAVQPTVAAVRAHVGKGSPFKESGKTAASIHASVDKASEVGTVKISIGADAKNAYKLRLNEVGSSKVKAYPSLRPGYDETSREVLGNLAHGLRRISRLGGR
jgi:HK97 gp10 family phage protein